MDETILIRSFHDENNNGMPTVEPGLYMSEAIIPKNILGPTAYSIIIRAGIYNVRSCFSSKTIKINLHVVNTGQYNKAYLGDTFRAKLAPQVDWITEGCHEKNHF
jgi:hypothetical protein